MMNETHWITRAALAGLLAIAASASAQDAGLAHRSSRHPVAELVRQGPDGKTVVSINDHRWLQAHHGIGDDLAGSLAGLPALLAAALD
jgi:hypothetical protein